jgi:hypothetical protein
MQLYQMTSLIFISFYLHIFWLCFYNITSPITTDVERRGRDDRICTSHSTQYKIKLMEKDR